MFDVGNRDCSRDGELKRENSQDELPIYVGRADGFHCYIKRGWCAALRLDTESPLLSPSRCPCARAHALQSISSGKKRVVGRKCTYARS